VLLVQRVRKGEAIYDAEVLGSVAKKSPDRLKPAARTKTDPVPPLPTAARRTIAANRVIVAVCSAAAVTVTHGAMRIAAVRPPAATNLGLNPVPF
jgi:hypothetical protein